MAQPVKKKPRVRFCWVCSKKLYGNHHKEVTGPDGNNRIMHKFCAENKYDPKDVVP